LRGGKSKEIKRENQKFATKFATKGANFSLLSPASRRASYFNCFPLMGRLDGLVQDLFELKKRLGVLEAKV
jgi:hypothetical protein